MTDQPDLFRDGVLPDRPPRFDGATFEPSLDGERLATQVAFVRDVMRDGGWHTLPELARAFSARFGRPASEASLSARIRDLRKPRFGGYTVLRRRRTVGLFEYHLSASAS